MAINNDINIIIKSQDEASKNIKKISGEISGLKESLDTTKKSVSTFGDTFKALVSYDIVRTIGGQILNVGKSVITLSSNLQQAQISFTTMLGSADKASKLLKDLSDFAKVTPFELVGIRESAKQLLAMGVANENLIPTMKALGDVAAGLSVPLDRLALAYGQVLAKGRLQGGELKQFTEAGVPLLATLSEQLGKTTGEISKMVERGEISATDVTKAFEKMTSEGGKFANLMGEQSKTLAGKWSNLGDSLSQLGETIGTKFLPTLGVIIEGMNEAVGTYGESIGAILTSTLDLIGITFSELSKNTKEATKDQLTFGKVILYIGAAISSLFSSLFFVITSLGKFVGATFAAIVYGAGDTFDILVTIIGTAFKSMLQFSASFGQNFGEAFKLGVSKAIEGINFLINQANKLLGTSFKTFSTIGGGKFNTTFVDTAVNGALKVAKSAEKIKGTFAAIGGKYVNDVAKDFKNLGEAIKAPFEIIGMSGDIVKSQSKKIGKIDYSKITNTGGEEGGKKAKGGKTEAEKSLDKLKDLAKDTKTALEGVFKTLSGDSDKSKNKILGLKDEYSKLKDKLTEVGLEGAKALQDIQDKLDKQILTISEIKLGGKMDVATRNIEVQKELNELKQAQIDLEKEYQKDSRTGISGEELEKYINDKKINDEKQKQLEAELKLSEEYAGQKNIAIAKLESEKSETQLIIDKTNQKILEAEAERSEIQKTLDAKKLAILQEQEAIKIQMDAKKAEIKSEYDLYKLLIAQRQQLEANYFSLFQKNITEQIDKTKEAINLMNSLNSKTGGQAGSLIEGARADGGPVRAGGTYLVGERGPELFTPRTSGQIIPNGATSPTININLGGVAVNNQQDANYLVSRIKSELTREMQLFKLGIS